MKNMEVTARPDAIKRKARAGYQASETGLLMGLGPRAFGDYTSNEKKKKETQIKKKAYNIQSQSQSQRSSQFLPFERARERW